MVDCLPGPEERLSLSKEWNFWPGYVRTLKSLAWQSGRGDEREADLLWDEMPTLLRKGDAKLLSALGMMSTEEDCAAVLAVKVRSALHFSPHTYYSYLICLFVKAKLGRTSDGVVWDSLGLEVVKNLGADLGRAALIRHAYLLPKGCFSPEFYREMIRRSLGNGI